jgi:hypothetical protein
VHKRAIDADEVAQPTASARESYKSSVVTAIEEILLAGRTLGAANCWLHSHVVANLQSGLVLRLRTNLHHSTGEFMAEANGHRFASDGMWVFLRWNESGSRVLMKICTADANKGRSSANCQQVLVSGQ